MSWKQRLAPFGPLILGVLGNGVGALLSLDFRDVPPGARIRPMAWAGEILLLAGLAFWVGLALTVINFKKKRGRLLSLAGMILCLTPFWAAVVVMLYYQQTIGFELEE
jgi:hypothetical protein